MYLAEVRLTDFRGFAAPGHDHGVASGFQSVFFNRGLTALVGENNSGKTSIVDAIRMVLLTSSNDYYRISPDDFYSDAHRRSTSFTITCRFCDLDDDEKGQFFEILTPIAGGQHELFVTLTAEQLDAPTGRISVSVRSWPQGDGPAVDGKLRELLRTTYLRPLRDAENELRPGRRSRLSQILNAYPGMRGQDQSDYSAELDTASTIVGLMHRAESGINGNQVIARARNQISSDYLSNLAIGQDILDCRIGLAATSRLASVLEKLELSFIPASAEEPDLRHGLGYSNALFMSAELLLLDNAALAPLLLIEEPEAHLHPQLQSRVMELLLRQSRETINAGENLDEKPEPALAERAERQVQIILTTHSPNLACGFPVQALAVVAKNRVFSLTEDKTLLDRTDYGFLRRFLDVTKANMFFARGVVVVEGDAEAILLPALAANLGKSFSKLGLSVVNVGHVGLFRYSRIFMRQNGETMPVKVACIRDMDVPPNGTPQDLRGHLKTVDEFTDVDLQARRDRLAQDDQGSVQTFVSDTWTLEYDFAAASWPAAKVIYQACQLARKAESSGSLVQSQLDEIASAAEMEVDLWQSESRTLAEVALEIYRPLRLGKISKVVTAQCLAEVLVSTRLQVGDIPTYLRDAFVYLGVTD